MPLRHQIWIMFLLSSFSTLSYFLIGLFISPTNFPLLALRGLPFFRLLILPVSSIFFGHLYWIIILNLCPYHSGNFFFCVVLFVVCRATCFGWDDLPSHLWDRRRLRLVLSMIFGPVQSFTFSSTSHFPQPLHDLSFFPKLVLIGFYKVYIYVFGIIISPISLVSSGAKLNVAQKSATPRRSSLEFRTFLFSSASILTLHLTFSISNYVRR